MDNVVLTSSSQISPNKGNPLNPRPGTPLDVESPRSETIEALIGTPLEPSPTVGTSEIDGNVQAHLDVNYQSPDVAIATAPKTNGHQQNGYTLGEHHKMDIEEDGDDHHPDKAKPCCSMLNKLFLALAIVCFALFLISVAFIVANLDRFGGRRDGRVGGGIPILAFPHRVADYLVSSEKPLSDSFFNLTHPNGNGLVVVLSRRGAAIHDILLPTTIQNGTQLYRSIVLKGGDSSGFGAIRFGADGANDAGNLTYGLQTNYPFYDAYVQEWSMYADRDKPYRVRFIRGLAQIIYEFPSADNNELSMTTMVATPSNQQIIVDPTNNIYFNLRGYGNLSTHHLNVSSSNPINIEDGQKSEQDQISQPRSVDDLPNLTDYFYKLDHAGIGKNYAATLTEKETHTTVRVFADHVGVFIDPFGFTSNGSRVTSTPNMRGIRISPRQSPVHLPQPLYGPTVVIHPSQAIHTTWWQFEY